VGGADGQYGLTRLSMTPDPSPGSEAEAIAAVLVFLARLDPERLAGQDGTALACLPAPHPAVRVLLAAGWQVEEYNLFMATDPTLIDPRRTAPSPALA
jgi:hypothetical protein